MNAAPPSRVGHEDLRIGTLAGKGDDTAGYIAAILPHGFESFQINFWQQLPNKPLEQIADEVRAVLDDYAEQTGRRAVVSSLGLFGNPLQDDAQAQAFAACIDACPAFGCDLVAGWPGALEDRPVDESMDRYRAVWSPLARRAADAGVRIAFENCDMGGTWDRPRYNIAHSPRAWSMMFDALDADNVGLEWEPCHQLVSLIDPIAQLREWMPTGKVFHLHGKCATVMWDVIRRHGLRGGEPVVYHRHPGMGDCDWRQVIDILRLNHYQGAIDIEGWHDPVYKGDLEMTGQVQALRYLQGCRGGGYTPSPEGFADDA